MSKTVEFFDPFDTADYMLDGDYDTDYVEGNSYLEENVNDRGER